MSFKEVMLKAQEEAAKREQHYEAVREKRKQEIQEIIEGFESSPRNRRASNIKRAFKENCHRNIKVNGPLVAKRLLQAQQVSGLSPTRYCDSIKMQLEIFRYLTEQKPSLISASEQRILIAAGVFNEQPVNNQVQPKPKIEAVTKNKKRWSDNELALFTQDLTLDQLCDAMPHRSRHAIIKHMASHKKEKLWITNDEAAEMMKCSKHHIMKLRDTGEIPTVLINGNYRIPLTWRPDPLPEWEAVTIIEAFEMVNKRISTPSFSRYSKGEELESYKYLDRVYLRKDQIELLVKHLDAQNRKGRKNVDWTKFHAEWLDYSASL